MTVEYVLMIVITRIAHIDASIIDIIELSVMLRLPTLILFFVWELLLRKNVAKHRPEFAEIPVAFTGSFGERWNRFRELPLWQRIVLVGIGLECDLTVASTILVILLDVIKVNPLGYLLLRLFIEQSICIGLFWFAYPVTSRKIEQHPK